MPRIRYVKLETAGRGGDLDSIPEELDWPDDKPIPEGAVIIGNTPTPVIPIVNPEEK